MLVVVVIDVATVGRESSCVWTSHRIRCISDDDESEDPTEGVEFAAFTGIGGAAAVAERVGISF